VAEEGAGIAGRSQPRTQRPYATTTARSCLRTGSGRATVSVVAGCPCARICAIFCVDCF
jgi:hypothetical protein